MARRRDAGPAGPSDPAAALARIAAAEEAALAALWRTRRAAPPPPAMTERLLRLALAWDAQADAAPASARRVARRLDRLASGAGDAPRRPRCGAPQVRLKPGATLVRDWGGRTYRVEARADGRFDWNGQTWRSLSAIARAITGTRRNGPAFFGLREARGEGGGDGGG